MEISYWQSPGQWWFASEGRNDSWEHVGHQEFEASVTHQRKDPASRCAV